MGKSQKPFRCGYRSLIGMPVSVAATSVRIFTPGCRSNSSTIPTPPYPPHPTTLTFNMICLFLFAIRAIPRWPIYHRRTERQGGSIRPFPAGRGGKV